MSIAVYGAEILHGFSSCTLGPAIAALSLAIAGQSALGRRLGRNARFASIGNGIGAAMMGAAGYYISERSVFFLTAALTLPAFYALRQLSQVETPVYQAGQKGDTKNRQATPDRQDSGRSPAADLFDLRRPLYPVGLRDAADRRRRADPAGRQ